jgi:hypothetical protein
MEDQHETMDLDRLQLMYNDHFTLNSIWDQEEEQNLKESIVDRVKITRQTHRSMVI